MKRIQYILFLLLFTGSVHAQQATVSVDVDSTTYLIGEWIQLHLSVDAPAEWQLRMPSQDDDFDQAEFISTEEAKKEVIGKRQQVQQTCIVTVFDTGRIPVSAIVRYTKPDDTTKYTLTSEAVTFDITTVELDTTMTFKDIRDVLHVPLTIWDYLLYAGVILLIALLLWFAYRWYKNRDLEEEEETGQPDPELPAHIIALQELESIRGEQLWQNGKHKQYQSRVTDVLRGYIERRFDVPALEHPTSEIIPDVAMLGLKPSDVSGLESVLRTADLTKFAKHIPGAVENEEAMRFSVDFVEETKRDEAEAVPTMTSTEENRSDTGDEVKGASDDVQKEGGDV